MIGCTGPDHTIESAQAIGLWKADDGGQIEFTSDGRFEMSGIARSAVVFSFSEPPPGDDPLAGAGTWELKNQRLIELSHEKGGSFSHVEPGSMGIAESGKNPLLYFSTNSDKEYGYEVQKGS
ncbi:hypothetical protein ABZ154_30630 [Streptomyces sp. NPDC006261]|uniref:hypothetical protein n=1 Tax=Streptomyces sp. NPDC006261 TaxID=3156739 RepID=UPI0033A20E55